MRSSHVFTLIGLVAVCNAQTYPATFPFENENYDDDFISLPASTPSSGIDQFTDKDVGGYIYSRALWMDTDVFVLPFCHILTGYAEYALVAVFGLPPVLPVEAWNCTAKDIVFADSDFTGEVGARLCSVGACCKELIGLAKYGDDQMQWHATIKGIVETSACKAGEMLEAVYCGLVDGHYRTNCIERMISPSERLVIMACPDGHKLFWMTCPLILSAGMFLGMDLEPPLYDDALSPVLQINREILVNNIDKVCHPYSYYAGDSASSVASVTSATSTTTSPSHFVTSSLFTFGLFLCMML